MFPPKVGMERRRIQPLRPEGKGMTAQAAMWYPCQAFPGVKPLPGDDADAMAVGMPMDHRRIGMGDTTLTMPRKDQTVSRSEVDGSLTL